MPNKIELPKSMPDFAEKTLVACLAHKSAIFYFGEKNSLVGPETFEPESVQYEYSDKEGFSFGNKGGTGTSPGTEGHNKEHYQRVFLNELQSKLQDIINTGVKKIIFFIPSDIKNMVQEKLSGNIIQISDFRDGNLIKEQPLKLLERIYA